MGAILSVTPLMRYVTEIGRLLLTYGDLEDGQMLDFIYFWAGRCSCKRSFLAKHGVFNRQFQTIIEDMELGYRLSKFGFRVVFHRPAVTYVARPLTFEDFCDRCERQGEALFLLSQLHDAPVVQQYCQCADPLSRTMPSSWIRSLQRATRTTARPADGKELDLWKIQDPPLWIQRRHGGSVSRSCVAERNISRICTASQCLNGWAEFKQHLDVRYRGILERWLVYY